MALQYLAVQKILIYLMNNMFKKITTTLFAFFVTFNYVEAFEYTLLESLPNVPEKITSFSEYMLGLFDLAITIAIILAVFQLSRAGFVYLTSEAITKKAGARSIINKALLGLGLALAAYMILNFIDPDLVDTDFSIPEVGDVGGSSE